MSIPTPHIHGYNKENDGYEEEILNHWQWIHFPLEDAVIKLYYLERGRTHGKKEF